MVLAVVPLLTVLGGLAEEDWATALTGAVSVVGAAGAAYALINFKREHVRPLILCLLITSALDAVEGGVAARLAVLGYSLLQYAAITFVMEEVTFLMLDDHLHGGRRDLGLTSAVILSVLWALWHLPGSDDLSWQTMGVLLYVHVPYGVCLAVFWRRTGSLLIPALAHSQGGRGPQRPDVGGVGICSADI